MNVFRKISSTTNNNNSIFHTQKKQPIKKSLIPQSAQKLAAKQQQCFYLIDYEIRANGLLICKLSKDHNFIKRIGWRKLKDEGIVQCIVKNKQSQEMWIGRQYWFVNIKRLGGQEGGSRQLNDNDDGYSDGDLKDLLLLGGKYVADKAILVNQGKNQSIQYQKR